MRKEEQRCRSCRATGTRHQSGCAFRCPEIRDALKRDGRQCVLALEHPKDHESSNGITWHNTRPGAYQ